MERRISAIILRNNTVLLVKLKEQDKLMPRATWVFPFLSLSEDTSPRRELNNFLNKLVVKYALTEKIFKYNPSENPKLTYYLYVAEYRGGEPEVSTFFQAYKWVPIKDITAYSTSFMDGNVSKYLNEIAEKEEENFENI
ncbi:MAG: hypothetical protein M1348_01865 [Candidatus Parvarchaeota archaeon]|nr:hypothetical protein [Candidatus Parvarchaeota archaeon]MCL5101337.1 hypothetical protein [Candidatus Parvarchaeota archaeon]